MDDDKKQNRAPRFLGPIIIIALIIFVIFNLLEGISIFKQSGPIWLLISLVSFVGVLYFLIKDR